LSNLAEKYSSLVGYYEKTSYRPLVGSVETQGSCTVQPLNSLDLARVIHHMCAAIPQQYIYRHILSMSTRYLAVDATVGGYTKC